MNSNSEGDFTTEDTENLAVAQASSLLNLKQTAKTPKTRRIFYRKGRKERKGIMGQGSGVGDGIGEFENFTDHYSLPTDHCFFTTEVDMRDRKKQRHNIIYKTQSGYIGYIPVIELGVQSSYSNHIYGECNLQSLESFKKNEISRLANIPLTPAVESFISQKVQEYSKEFEAQDRRKYDQEAKNAISKINEALDKWKNMFLKEFLQGLWGAGGIVDPPPQPSLPTGKPRKTIRGSNL